MDLKSGMPFWLIKNGLMFNYPKLEKDLDVDVLILGCGITFSLITAEIITDLILGKENDDAKIFAFQRA